MKKLFALMFMFVFVLLIGGVSAIWDDSLNVGSIGAWLLDETDNPTGVFDSTNLHNGSNIGATKGATGIRGNAFDFEESERDYLVLNRSSLTDNLATWTISFWIKAESIPQFPDTVSKATTSSSGWGFDLADAPDVIRLLTSDGSFVVFANQPVNTGQFYHILATYDGTEGSFYINGTLVEQKTFNYAGNTQDIYVGVKSNNINGGGRHWDGIIDEIFLWNRSLTDGSCSVGSVCGGEVANVYNSHTGVIWVDLDLPTSPTIILNSPIDNSNKTNGTITFNATITPNSFNVTNATSYIWYSNGTTLNVTTNIITGNSSNTTIFNVGVPFIADGYIWNVKGCRGDGIGDNCSFSDNNVTFNVKKIFQFGSQQYNTPVLEQTTQDFKVNISLSDGFSISTITLIYNNSNFAGTFTTISSTITQAEVTLITPDISSDINITFNWSILLTDSTIFITSSNNQTILNLGLDDCSVNTIQILNFTLVDEESQKKLTEVSDNTSIKIDLDLYTNSSKTTVALEFSQDYTDINPARVCISNSIANSTYLMDATVQYDAKGFANEFYHLQSYELNGTTGSGQNITLYDLNDSDVQEFIISFKDESFLAVRDALIQIQRKYVDEGVSKVVELPKTDINGEVVGHLVLNDVIYSFTVVKNGVLLGTFGEVNAVCQNPTIEDCVINLNSFSSSIEVTEFAVEKDFTFTLTYDETTRTVSTTFTIPSGAVSFITLNVTKADALGTTICNIGVTTSAGTLNCAVANSFGNGTVMAEIYKDTVLVAQGSLRLEQEPEDIYGASLVFIGLFVMLTLIGAGISENPVFTVVFLMIGVILLFAMNLVDSTGFIGATATILWIIMAFILIMIKGVKRN